MDIRRVLKIGGSYACVVPVKYWAAIGVGVGDNVAISLDNGSIRIRKLALEKLRGSAVSKTEASHGE
jgi:antitoxin component of MazEF toxin-antitoxin module